MAGPSIIFIGTTYTASDTVTNASNSPITTATVTGVITESDRSTIKVASFSMTHSGSGIYTATISATDTATLSLLQSYFLKTTVTNSGSQDIHYQELIAKYNDN